MYRPYRESTARYKVYVAFIPNFVLVVKRILKACIFTMMCKYIVLAIQLELCSEVCCSNGIVSIQYTLHIEYEEDILLHSETL